MTFGMGWAPYGASEGFRRLQSLIAPGAVALATSAALAVWTFNLRPIALPHHVAFETAAPEQLTLYGALSEPGLEVGPPPAPLARLSAPDRSWLPHLEEVPPQVAGPWRLSFERRAFGELADPNFALGPSRFDSKAASGPSVRSEPLANPSVLASAPLPPRRPSELAAASTRPARAAAEVAPPPAQTPDNRSIFEKLFGSPKSETTVVAYASPESATPRSPILNSANPADSATSGTSTFSRYDKFTAVYDIAAHTVYLPSGAKLVAHSGLGAFIDDPSHVNVHAKGATPPDTYELSPREALFHGVQALRLKPVGSGQQFGRTGLLVHPYMLGENGDSFGCVSVQDYDAFLHAYQSGEVKRLVVVAKQ